MTGKNTATRSYHHGDLKRALLDAALALLAEEQGWNFSIRELARRAGVSHNAPNKHFPAKRDLLAALAARGFEMLRNRMLAESERVEPTAALAATGVAYIQFAAENPALYRLMFRPELAGALPDETGGAGAGAKVVLEDAILRAAEAGLLSFPASDVQARATAALTCWSAVHGLATLLIDGKVPAEPSAGMLAGAMVGYLIRGLMR